MTFRQSVREDIARSPVHQRFAVIGLCQVCRCQRQVLSVVELHFGGFPDIVLRDGEDLHPRRMIPGISRNLNAAVKTFRQAQVTGHLFLTRQRIAVHVQHADSQ